MTKEELLAELENLIRTMPPRESLHHPEPENFAWLGEVAAVLELVNIVRFSDAIAATKNVHSGLPELSYQSINNISVSLYKARAALIRQTKGPASIALDQGQVFRYFDELRKKIELASTDLLFIDPYLDADFVSRYLVHCRESVQVRLLTAPNKKLQTLMPAIERFSAEIGNPVLLRLATGLHDRYLFVDRQQCYQSGASFKDGGRNAPTTITEIVDAIDAMLGTYEDKWDSAKQVFPT